MASRIASSSRTLYRAAPSPSLRRCLSSSPARFASPAPSTSSDASNSTPPPPSSASSSSLSPKLSQIVEQISSLTLLEAADLVVALKDKLNIVEVAMPAASSAAAPAAAAGAAKDEGAAAEAEKPKEKTTFNVTLDKIDSAQKAKVIREVKAIMPSMNLVEAKKFVESLPKVLKEGATKEEAEKLQKAMKAVGAEVSLD